jgi:hypothetical protein
MKRCVLFVFGVCVFLTAVPGCLRIKSIGYAKNPPVFEFSTGVSVTVRPISMEFVPEDEDETDNE